MHCPTLAELPPPPRGKTGFPWTSACESVVGVWPRVSIVTPSFNQAQFLEETIRSVLLQGYPNLEYIVIDGGSTDGSVELIRKYAPWLSYWVSEPDYGQSDAINKGWRHATGEILAWLNSDDQYAANALRCVAEKFIAEPALGLVFGEIRVLDRSGKLSGAMGYHHLPTTMLAQFEIPYQPASFFRRTRIQPTGMLDPSLHYVMDVELLLRVMSNTPFAYLPTQLAIFRIHSASKTDLAERQFAEELLKLREHVLSQLDAYPALQSLGKRIVSRNFYRLASKHLYQANWFRQALRCIVHACRDDPSATLTILADEGIGWLMKRILPINYYRRLSYALRAKARHSG